MLTKHHNTFECENVAVSHIYALWRWSTWQRSNLLCLRCIRFKRICTWRL